jgi:hypothetical protein
MTELDIRLDPGFAVEWVLSVSGISDDEDGLSDHLFDLSEVESEIEQLIIGYECDTGSSVIRIHGSHGWREYEWSDGAIHHYGWTHHLVDLRCPYCKSVDTDLYMVTDEIWDGSGLDGHACFRCLEQAIGRKLSPDDFKPGVPANDGELTGAELRSRMGLSRRRKES